MYSSTESGSSDIKSKNVKNRKHWVWCLGSSWTADTTFAKGDDDADDDGVFEVGEKVIGQSGSAGLNSINFTVGAAFDNKKRPSQFQLKLRGPF